MSERNFNVQFKECSISFTVHGSKIRCHTRGLVKTVAKTFASVRNCSKQHEDKVEYDRMRVMLEYADSHGATWCEIMSADASVIVTIYFDNTKSMIEFEEGVVGALERMAMK